MLLNLHIKNIALIDDIDIGFEEGLNILTGETGAGKSIIIGSLRICLGEKFSKDLLRDIEEDGLIELVFFIENKRIINDLAKLEIVPDSEGQIFISRRMNKSGRVINRINDFTVTTAKLKEAAALLVDLHAQHEQQTLLKKNKHLEILDSFGGDALEECKKEVAKLYKDYTDAYEKLCKMNLSKDERLRKKDYLTYRINEIESANLKEDEDKELQAFYKKAVNSKEILSLADDIYRITGYDERTSAANEISRAVLAMKKLSELDDELNDSYSLLQDVDALLNDFNREFSDYTKSMDFDEAEFKQTEKRLDLINNLKLKYGDSIKDIMESLDDMKKEYEELLNYDDRLLMLGNEVSDIKTRLSKKSDELSELRRKTSVKICSIITDSLKELNFMTVSFDMKFDKTEGFSANGNDEAYFVISTNVGEPLRPLYEVASGGELSRVMLAIKSCMAYEDDTPTLVFDEIDVGISGKTAGRVAEKMALISRSHQVICITHLPQIAAMADHHYSIEKNVEKNKTITKIRKLNKSEEIDELARILGGDAVTDAVRTSAAEMKGLADSTKLY
ncbi:MAG: DNA repair protein RecN [Lachnospiraceae bacterium]|nr:DNA repair protein RecN [Lachnospiraceae bacterium]